MKILTILALLSIPVMVQAAPLSVGDLEDYPTATESSCGLFLENASGKLAFYADTHFSGFLKVDGKVAELAHIKTQNHQRKEGVTSKGDSYKSTFATAGVQAVLDMTVTKGCESNTNKCEDVQVKGSLVVTANGQKSRQSVHGAEHCDNQDD